jgi:cytochrome b involved in lipid metabolism
MSKRSLQRNKIFVAADVEEKCREGKCWITKDGRVYDVTAFACDHPGGEDVLLAYAGKDVGEIMASDDEHRHSDSAYELLAEYQVGILGREAKIVDGDAQIDEDFYPQETAVVDDYKAHQFLDLDRPLVMQIVNASFSKNFYLQQVHQPRHLPQPARFFGPDVLEMVTRTHWWVVPLIWGPITAALFARSVAQQQPHFSPYNPLEWTFGGTQLAWTMACFFFGNFVWTVLEYGLHRFLFHVDDFLPDRPIFLALHFLLHGQSCRANGGGLIVPREVSGR